MNLLGNKPLIGVYRDCIPIYSETFISDHLAQLSKYGGFYITRKILNAEKINYPYVVINKNFINYLAVKNFSGFDLNGNLDGRIKSVSAIHAHFAQDGLVASDISEKIKVPLLVSIHGSDVTLSSFGHILTKRLSSLLYVLNKKNLFARAELFLPASKFLAKKMVEIGFPEKKIVQHYIGVDVDYYSPGASNTKNNKNYILCVARHSEVKGIDVLIKAFSIFCQKNSDTNLVVIGSGDLFDYNKGLALHLGLQNRVNFIGAQPSSVVRDYMRNCIVNILPSRRTKSGAEEGLGLVLLETQACGRPCIGTNVGGISEAFIDGETGICVPPEDPHAMAEAILFFVDNYNLSKKFGDKGIEWVKLNFDKKSRSKRLEEIYDGIIS